MTGMPTIYCLQCRALRAVSDWREWRDKLLIQLEPCSVRRANVPAVPCRAQMKRERSSGRRVSHGDPTPLWACLPWGVPPRE